MNRFTKLLVHRCTLIEPGVFKGKDEYNRDIYEDVKTPDVSCRLDQIRQSTGRGETGADYLLEYMLFLPAEAKANREMKIEDVADKAGNIIFPGVFTFDPLIPIYQRGTLHHYEATLREG